MSTDLNERRLGLRIDGALIMRVKRLKVQMEANALEDGRECRVSLKSITEDALRDYLDRHERRVRRV